MVLYTSWEVTFFLQYQLFLTLHIIFDGKLLFTYTLFLPLSATFAATNVLFNKSFSLAFNNFIQFQLLFIFTLLMIMFTILYIVSYSDCITYCIFSDLPFLVKPTLISLFWLFGVCLWMFLINKISYYQLVFKIICVASSVHIVAFCCMRGMNGHVFYFSLCHLRMVCMKFFMLSVINLGFMCCLCGMNQIFLISGCLRCSYYVWNFLCCQSLSLRYEWKHFWS